MNCSYLKIGEKSVELRFTARRAAALEADLGEGLLAGLSKSDRVSVAAKYLSRGADISLDEAYDLYDEYIESGGTLEELNEVIVEGLQNGGFLSKAAIKAAEELKSRLEKKPRQG